MSESTEPSSPTEVAVVLRDDGILEYDYASNVCVDIEVARKAVDAARRLVDEPVPTLVHVSQVKEVTREARIFFSQGEENQLVSSRVALIIGSPLGRIIGNFFMGLNKGAMPVQLFTDVDAAVEWLRS